MPKRAGEQDTLRKEYDLDELTLVNWGPGYGGKPSVGKSRVRRREKPGELGEAVKLLKRARPYLKETQRAEVLREQIEDFLGRVE